MSVKLLKNPLIKSRLSAQGLHQECPFPLSLGREKKSEEIMYHRIIVALLTVSVLLAACAGAAPAPTPEPPETGPYPPPLTTPDDPVTAPPYPEPGGFDWEVQPGDEQLTRGEVFLDSVQILVLESFPPQFMLNVSGSLPTPCHELRAEVSDLDAQNRIEIELYSLVDPDVICVQVLEPFEENIYLGTFPTGTYVVLVNGERVGEIEAP
jgi:hypothetical protein